MNLRLLLFEDCNRSCKGCCNKQWDLSKLPVETDFTGYDKIILTGGEPMLKPEYLKDVIRMIRSKTDAKIVVYTAKVDDRCMFLDIIEMVDGVTVTLHKSYDWIPFKYLDEALWAINDFGDKTFRLNIFKEVNTGKIYFDKWQIKDDIVWIEDCPLPKNEIFKRIGNI